MYDVSYTWTLKKANKKTKLIESENRLVVARGRGWEVGEMGKGESEGKKKKFRFQYLSHFSNYFMEFSSPHGGLLPCSGKNMSFGGNRYEFECLFKKPLTSCLILDNLPKISIFLL